MPGVAELGTDDEDAMTMDTDATFTKEIKTSTDDDESVKSRDKKPKPNNYKDLKMRAYEAIIKDVEMSDHVS